MLTNNQRNSLAAYLAAVEAVYGGVENMPWPVERQLDATRIRLLEDEQQRRNPGHEIERPTSGQV